ncbi:cupin domain-containing protein [Halobaculum rubrum]|uniref:cupin domain-containing protein n=1 Tax=Halobaculum rubrum TaxID=2872158 RepID=UPI001CA445F8|nr:cupin domain-containing protein [Halobaculum rubrum]QZX99373.1 cupin domain-containing protein [Halobaculum rubrum]
MTTVRPLAELEGEPHANVFPGDEPKTIRLTLADSETVPPHTHPGRDIVLYLLEGAIELHLDEEIHEVTAGDIARFEGEREISPRALEDSVALLVLAPRSDE